jgi:hypothetical protein
MIFQHLSRNNEEALEGGEGPRNSQAEIGGGQASCIDNVLVSLVGSHLALIHLFPLSANGNPPCRELVSDKPVAVWLGESWGLGRTGVPQRVSVEGSTGRLAPSAALILLVAVLIGLGADLVGHPS